VFREIKLEERAVSDEKVIDIFKAGSYGVLSTIGEDGYPYGVPLNYTYFDHCICFHCALEGHKVENVQYSEKVSFCVVTNSEVLASKFDTDYESAIAFGRVSEVGDAAEKKDILLSVMNKYSKDYQDAGMHYMKKYWDETKVFKIEIEHMSGKAHE
jgi:nitroimidazol reductase NimA-like FMN-containing flavoprotein (pyridoxamine 5'-phosphate oxidase superfamily)